MKERDHDHHQYENDDNNRHLARQVSTKEAGDGGSNDEHTQICNCMLLLLSGGFCCAGGWAALLEANGVAAEGVKRCRAATIASQRTLRWPM